MSYGHLFVPGCRVSAISSAVLLTGHGYLVRMPRPEMYPNRAHDAQASTAVISHYQSSKRCIELGRHRRWPRVWFSKLTDSGPIACMKL